MVAVVVVGLVAALQVAGGARHALVELELARVVDGRSSEEVDALADLHLPALHGGGPGGPHVACPVGDQAAGASGGAHRPKELQTRPARSLYLHPDQRGPVLCDGGEHGGLHGVLPAGAAQLEPRHMPVGPDCAERPSQSVLLAVPVAQAQVQHPLDGTGLHRAAPGQAADPGQVDVRPLVGPGLSGPVLDQRQVHLAPAPAVVGRQLGVALP